jgi:hypothetical protein
MIDYEYVIISDQGPRKVISFEQVTYSVTHVDMT